MDPQTPDKKEHKRVAAESPLIKRSERDKTFHQSWKAVEQEAKAANIQAKEVIAQMIKKTKKASSSKLML
jgi:hypothetical protein